MIDINTIAIVACVDDPLLRAITLSGCHHANRKIKSHHSTAGHQQIDKAGSGNNHSFFNHWHRTMRFGHICMPYYHQCHIGCPKANDGCFLQTLFNQPCPLCNQLPCPPAGDLSDPGTKSASPVAIALQADSLPSSYQGSPN